MRGVEWIRWDMHKVNRERCDEQAWGVETTGKGPPQGT